MIRNKNLTVPGGGAGASPSYSVALLPEFAELKGGSDRGGSAASNHVRCVETIGGYHQMIVQQVEVS